MQSLHTSHVRFHRWRLISSTFALPVITFFFFFITFLFPLLFLHTALHRRKNTARVDSPLGGVIPSGTKAPPPLWLGPHQAVPHKLKDTQISMEFS